MQKILSVEHKELAERTIDGVLCEGLETSDPAVMGAELVEIKGHLACFYRPSPKENKKQIALPE